MSITKEKHWSWAIAGNMNIKSKRDVEILLRRQKKCELITIMKENYEIEDKDLIPFEQLPIKKLKPKLSVRRIYDTYTLTITVRNNTIHPENARN